ncbi:MAG: pyridoxamine 5'-phosphate oxidase family protein [Acidimicrobiales bacterium]
MAGSEQSAGAERQDGGSADVLASEECFRLLQADTVGRIAFVAGEHPVVLPVNYRAVLAGRTVWVIIRTHPGGSIDRAPLHASFQVDGVDARARLGWSVLVRGALVHLDEAAVAELAGYADPQPWLAERDSWLALKATAVTGRRVHGAELQWAFHLRAYI